ncbi:MAG: tetratricopeptide repeat protein [Pseudomonadota bacterium]
MDPNVKKITRVVRYLMFFGLGFLAVGLLFLLLFLIEPTRTVGLTPDNVAIWVGVPVLLGAIFVCVRFGVIVDRLRLTVTTWWGLLVPFHKTEHPFSQAHFVTLSREERSAGRSSYEVFPVRLEGADTDAITIHEPRDHDKARHLAEDLAKFVHLGIRDRSSGEEVEVVREAGALDQSLQQRLRRAGRSTRLPAQPPGARTIFNYGGTRAPTTIEIPPVGHSVLLREFRLMIFPACLGALFLELASYNKGNMEIGVVGVASFFLFFLVIFLPLLIRSAILRERLVVSPDELVVTQRDIFGTKTTRLTSGEIEEVEVTRAKWGMSYGFAVIGGGNLRVAIRSDRGSIELGAALSKQEEVQWLRDVLVHVLAANSEEKVDRDPRDHPGEVLSRPQELSHAGDAAIDSASSTFARLFAYAPPVVLALGGAVVWLSGRVQALDLVDSVQAQAPYALVLGAGMLAWAAWLLLGRSSAHRDLLMIAAVTLIAIAFAIVTVGPWLNAKLERSQPTVRVAKVIEKNPHPRGWEWVLYVESWRQSRGRERIDVDRDTFSRARISTDSLVLGIRSGGLGFEWIESYHLKHAGQPAAGLVFRGWQLMQAGRLPEAERVLRQAVELDRRSFDARRYLDYVLMRAQRWDEILASWNEFLRLEPDHAAAYLERAGTHRHAGNAELALRDLERACSLGEAKACQLRERLR